MELLLLVKQVNIGKERVSSSLLEASLISQCIKERDQSYNNLPPNMTKCVQMLTVMITTLSCWMGLSGCSEARRCMLGFADQSSTWKPVAIHEGRSLDSTMKPSAAAIQVQNKAQKLLWVRPYPAGIWPET